MRLVVKKGGQPQRELRFTKGPVHIGRHADSQVILADRAVSRQHAVIFRISDGKWMLEDLDSANKTYLNDSAIHRAAIKSGDRIRIGDFIIEIDIGDDGGGAGHADLEDTLVGTPRQPRAITRERGATHGPDINLPSTRITDFLEATESICRAEGPDDVVHTLLTIMLKQFGAGRAWCALRNRPEGPMTSHAGKTEDGGKVELGDIEVKERITHALEEGSFVLLPQAPGRLPEQKTRSAMIAPLLDPSGCFGLLYVDNGRDEKPYTLSDLDYLMLLAIHTAAIVENF